jgi:hypothetical protein
MKKGPIHKMVLLIGLIVLAAGIGQPARADLLAFGGDVLVLGQEYPLWYQDANYLTLQACLDTPAGEEENFCLPAIDPLDEEFAGLEFLYSLAEAGIDFAGFGGSTGRALLILAMEGLDDEGTPVVLNEIIINMRGLQPGQNYTVTHPFGQNTVTAEANGRVRLIIPAIHPVDDFFEEALRGPIQKFLYWDSDLPLENEGSFYIGNPLVYHKIFGSPAGTNYFRVVGPGIPGGMIETDLFSVVGKIYTDAGNTAPQAFHDIASTRRGVRGDFDVLKNDLRVDVPINPIALEKPGVFTAATNGTVTTVRARDKVLARFTPNANFTGINSFTYRAESFTGQLSEPATVVVFVEDLRFTLADYRTRLGKWRMSGSSNFDALKYEPQAGTTVYIAPLSGGQEVPPADTAANGMFHVSFDSAAPGGAIEARLEVTVPQGTTVTAAHIHLGGTGVNGGRLFDLCGVGPAPACTVGDHGQIGITRSLGAGEFVGAGTGEVETFAEALTAIQEGRAYVNVHTTAYPAGELRGQIGRNVMVLRAGENGPVIGAAEVQPGPGSLKTWSFVGKSKISPAKAQDDIYVESSLGNTIPADLQIR